MLKRKYSIGMTLLESMVALVLTMITLSIVLTIYFFAHKNFLAQKNNLTAISEMKLATSVLQENIHQAGYIGCAQLSEDFPLKNNSALPIDARNKISSDQDGFAVWYAGSPSASLTKPMKNFSEIYADIAPEKNDVLLVSDCHSADIFVVKEVAEHHKITAAKTLSKLYGLDAEVFPLIVDSIYLKGHVLILKDIHHDENKLLQSINKMLIENIMVNNELHALSFSFQFDDMKFWYVYSSLREN